MLETASYSSDVQSAAVSGDGNSNSSPSSEEEDMLLETEVEVGEGFSEPTTVTDGPSGPHPSGRKRKPEAGPTLPVAGGRKKPKYTAVGTTFARTEEQNPLGAVTIRGKPYSVLTRIQLHLVPQGLKAILGSAIETGTDPRFEESVFATADFICELRTLCPSIGCNQALLP